MWQPSNNPPTRTVTVAARLRELGLSLSYMALLLLVFALAIPLEFVLRTQRPANGNGSLLVRKLGAGSISYVRKKRTNGKVSTR